MGFYVNNFVEYLAFVLKNKFFVLLIKQTHIHRFSWGCSTTALLSHSLSLSPNQSINQSFNCYICLPLKGLRSIFRNALFDNFIILQIPKGSTYRTIAHVLQHWSVTCVGPRMDIHVYSSCWPCYCYRVYYCIIWC